MNQTPLPAKPLFPPRVSREVPEPELARVKTLAARALAIVESGQVNSEIVDILNELWGRVELW